MSDGETLKVSDDGIQSLTLLFEHDRLASPIEITETTDERIGMLDELRS
jgi:hypothetical protein